MKYVSIDIETTGLDCNENQMIEFGAVIEDTENVLPIKDLPRFRALLLHKCYNVSPFCLTFHDELYKELVENIGKDYWVREAQNLSRSVVLGPGSHDSLAHEFLDFLVKNNMNGKIVVGGKNFNGFDKGFIQLIMPNVKFCHRTLDPSALFTRPEDKLPPSLADCARRAGIEFKENGYHTAISDAIMVIELLRAGWGLKE